MQLNSLKSYWDVYASFFRTMKNNKNGRRHLNINESIVDKPVWQNISYLGRIKVPKSIIDIVVTISEYNLKSVPLNQLFFSITKTIFNPYDGVNFFDENEIDSQFHFYSQIMINHVSQDLCLSFINHKITNIDYPIIELYNQISSTPIKCEHIDTPFVAGIMDIDNQRVISVINAEELEDRLTIDTIKSNIDCVKFKENNALDHAYLIFSPTPRETVTVLDYDNTSIEIKRSDINTKLVILTVDEKQWLSDYMKNSVKFSDYGTVVKKSEADFIFALNSGKITLKDELGNWKAVEQWYSDEDIEVCIKSSFENLDLIMSSDAFVKFLSLNDYIDLDNAVFSSFLLSDEFMKIAKEKQVITENIELYEYKLDKLKEEQGSETEILRIEMLLDTLYGQQLSTGNSIE